MWIVMSSSAHMPASCRGSYRNVALVQLNQEFTSHDRTPKMISARARGVLRLVHMGHHFDGTTDRCAFARTEAEAQRRAFALNNAAPDAAGDLLMSWGGSA